MIFCVVEEEFSRGPEWEHKKFPIGLYDFQWILLKKNLNFMFRGFH